VTSNYSGTQGNSAVRTWSSANGSRIQAATTRAASKNELMMISSPLRLSGPSTDVTKVEGLKVLRKIASIFPNSSAVGHQNSADREN
jgi:hypothetical protein